MKTGFSLLSFLLYLLLFTILTTISFHWVITSCIKSMATSRINNSVINAYMAYDIFMRDARMAPAQEYAWKKITPTGLIWHTKDHDIGWFFEHNMLIRIEGQYNKQKQIWRKKTRSIAAQHITSVIFDVEKSGNEIINIVTVFSIEVPKPLVLTNMIAIRNREL